jgi:Rrf2 family protein
VRISARADYAVRAAVELAAAGDVQISSEQISRAQDIPRPFLIKIMTELRRAGIVRSARGPDGGHLLARPAEEITVGDILRAIEGSLAEVHGEAPEEARYSGAAAPLSRVWLAMQAMMSGVLDSVTLADVAADELPTRISEAAQSPVVGRGR